MEKLLVKGKLRALCLCVVVPQYYTNKHHNNESQRSGEDTRSNLVSKCGEICKHRGLFIFYLRVQASALIGPVKEPATCIKAL